MIPSNREIALTKAIEWIRICGDGDVIDTAAVFLKFLDGPSEYDDIATLQARADAARGVHEFPHEVTE